MLLFLACIRSRKNKNRPSIRAVVRGDSLSELCVPRIERLPAQGTVASPGPVAGSDVTIGPLLMLVHLLSVAIDRCQRYSGTVTRHDSQGGSFWSHPRKRRVHTTSPVLGSIR